MRVRRGRHIQAAASLVGCLVLALSGATSAFGAEPPPYHSSFGPDGTDSTAFERAGPIAVDQQDHAVYVIDIAEGSPAPGSLLKFDTEGHSVNFGGSSPYISGNEITGLSFFNCPGCSQVAVDPISHDIYVTSENSVRAFHADGEPAEFTAGPGAGTSSIGGFSELIGLAVDASGDIYASDFFGGVSIYAHSGESITHFSTSSTGSGGPGNLAVDSSGAVYVNVYGESVYRFLPTEFPVTGATTYAAAAQPLGLGRSYTVAVNPANNEVYVAEYSPEPAIAWYGESGALVATFARAEEEGEIGAFPEGVAINSEEEELFVSNGRLEAAQVEIFWEQILPGPPKVKAVSAADVTADSATLGARINPSRAETTYRFEYGLEDCASSTCTSVPLIGASVGDGHKFIPVSQGITGLQANTTYHYRVFAENEHETNLPEEEDHTFTTQSGDLGFELGDSRAWEMVSPPNKHGALLEGSLNADVQAAANGEGLVYASRGSIEVDPEGSRAVETATVLAHRTADRWRSKDVTLPNNQASSPVGGTQGEYKLFSLDLSRAVVQARSNTPHSPGVSEAIPYLRENTQPPTYTPLLAEGNVPPGTQLVNHIRLQGVSRDLSHIVLSSEVPLVEGAPPGLAKSLYLWTAGQLQPVSVLPAAEDGELLGSGVGTVRNAISNNGSRIFWSAGHFNSGSSSAITALYLRDTEDEETVRLDVQPGPSGAGQPRPTFQGASADGTAVFFTDSQQLTEDASPSGGDLYRCEISADSPAAGCSSLVDISAPSEDSGESAEVEGLAPGLADDGSTIYFVARAVLDSGANEVGDTAVSGEANLYAWKEGQGVRFIASLSEEDENDWGGEFGNTYKLSAATSPSGRYLAFMSRRSLTGKDNLDAASGEPVEQVFRYDANDDRLDCVSCDPTGAAADGELVGPCCGPEFPRLVDPRSQWGGKRVAAMLPEPTVIQNIGVSLYAPRSVLDNGRVFFNAIDSLVPADSNGEWDVYQYEPSGIGDCTESSGDAATSGTAGGCVSLMSSGTGERESGFLDASETGDNVFFLTPAKLNAPDEDNELDVYDARVNGVPSTLPPRTECLGEACQPFTAPPNDATPGSASYRGPGNVGEGKHCPKGKRKVRRRGKTICVRKPHKHKGHHKPVGQSGRGQR
jgi:hypothetical protein